MEKNKMSYVKISQLIWKMGIPMIFSMILQAIYNVVDTIFVINSDAGTLGNEALTAAFPIQILIIAVGVGTGIGINALLSKNLGENNKEVVGKVAGNGIFLIFVIYAVFLLFGLFGAKPYMKLMANNETVIEYGSSYLRICCCLSLGAVGQTVYERFLQSTGKTAYSMIAQMSGAAANIILDALFIIVFKWGVKGAAFATIIGQFLALAIGMILHYTKNKDIPNSFTAIKPSGKIIKAIYKIGLPAAIMQGLLSLMMFVTLLIINTIDDTTTKLIMTNSFGIYYKIMQIGLFACFGLSNTLITITSFNYGMNNKERVNQTIKWGIIDSIITAGVITILFQAFANPIATLFGLSLEEVSATGITKNDILNTCVIAIRISTIGYIFMGISIGIQGILQGFRNVYKPVIISILRLIVFVVPFAILFVNVGNTTYTFWWTFPIAEVLTAVISAILLKDSVSKLSYRKIEKVKNVITISRTHGSRGKAIAKLLAEKLNYSYFDKENYMDVIESEEKAELYRSKEINDVALNAQADQIREIAKQGNVIIVGRAADYILRDEDVISIFITAPLEYRINQIVELYGDTIDEAKKNITKSDNSRREYYEHISGKIFGDRNNYSIYIDSDRGIEASVESIIKELKK